jgi:hypothetical protein
MPDNDKVTIWGGVPRFGTTPTTGQAIVGGGNGFVIYDSAKNNTGVVVIPGNTPLPNKNMEIAQKTVAGVTTQYYGFAGYCASYYSSSNQPNSTYENIVFFDGPSLEYGISCLGAPKTKLTALHAGVYKISGSLDAFGNETKGPSTQTITLSGTAPVSSGSGTGASQNIPLSGDPETITVNGQTITISGQTANLSGVTAPITFSWTDIALYRYFNVWIKKNGTLVSQTKKNIVFVGDYPRYNIPLDYMIYLDANDYVEIAWYATDGAGILDPNIELTVAGVNFPSALINMNMVR